MICFLLRWRLFRIWMVWLLSAVHGQSSSENLTFKWVIFSNVQGNFSFGVRKSKEVFKTLGIAVLIGIRTDWLVELNETEGLTEVLYLVQ